MQGRTQAYTQRASTASEPITMSHISAATFAHPAVTITNTTNTPAPTNNGTTQMQHACAAQRPVHFFGDSPTARTSPTQLPIAQDANATPLGAHTYGPTDSCPFARM